MPGDSTYPWYGIVPDDGIEQGDIFFDVAVFLPDYSDAAISTGESISGTVQFFDMIVLTQSCDLENRKKKQLSVILCPIFDLASAGQHLPSLKDKKVLEEVRQGKMPGHHMLGQCELAYFPSDVKIAFFHQVQCVPYSYILGIAERKSPRLRLLSPYKEHLGQAFARFMMRVGLPQDIPSFK